jgi:hypothetical protein
MGELSLLKSLFAEIIVANKVFEEVVVQGAGRPGSDEVQKADWIKTKTVTDQVAVSKLQHDELLGAGEAETLILAQELKADLTLIDDRKARRVAARMKVKRIGTLAMILMAYRKGLIQDLSSILKKAQQKAFRINQRIFDRLKKQGTPGQP